MVRASGRPFLLALSILIGAVTPVTSHAWSIDPGVNTPVATIAGDQVHIAAIPDGVGGTIIVWEDARGADRDIRAQRLDALGNASWTVNGVLVCGASGDQTLPRVVTDGAGGCIVGWIDHRGASLDIYAQRLDASGSALWVANGVVICNTAEDQQVLSLSADGSGGAFAAWADPRTKPNVYACAQHLNPGGAALWTANGVLFDQGHKNAARTQVASDGQGGAYVGYTLSNGSGYEVARLSPTGGLLFSQALQHASGVILDPELIPDGSGGVHIVWSNVHVPQDDGDIYAQHFNTSGVATWLTGGAPVAVLVGDQIRPAVVPDGAGGVVIAWQDARSDAGDIYAQRVNAAGAMQWATNGALVVADTGAQERPGLVLDGNGGYFVSWTAAPVGDRNVYARQVDGAGDALGAATGSPVCIASGVQDSVVVVPADPLGAVLVWEDGRAPANGKDIYTQRIAQLALLGPPPSITALVPAAAPPGTTISVRGLNLTNASVVEFGGVSIPFTTLSDSEIVATAPGCGEVRVTTPGGIAIAPQPFVSTPGISGFSPSSAAIGTAVRIQGSCFDGVSSVLFNGTPASTFSVNGESEILAIVPGASTTGPVTLMNSGGAATSVDFFSVLPLMGELPGCFFVPPFPSYSTGGSPRGIATGDFNHDGRPDVVIPNLGSGTVTAYYGTGGGAFGGRVDLPAGPHPASVAVGDFNEDGSPDLVVANQASNLVTVLLGTAGGSFGAPTSQTIPIAARSVAIGDINNDGHADILVGPQFSGPMTILRGTGTGSFLASLQAAGTNLGPTVELELSDLDKNGFPDVIAVDSTSGVGVWLNTTGLAFTHPGFNSNTSPSRHAVVADVNLDGKLDIVAVGDSTPSRVSVSKGRGNGQFDGAIVTSLPTGALSQDVVAPDLNDDGRPDVVVSDNADSTLFVFMNDGTGALVSPMRFDSPGMLPADLSAGDLDGDGRQDLLALNRASGQMFVLKNSGANDLFCPPFSTRTATGRLVAVVTGDFNRDGLMDAAAVDSTSNAVSVFLGTSSGDFQTPTNYNTSGLSGPRFMASGDFNQDGKLDLAVTGDGKQLFILFGNGAGGFPNNGKFGANAAAGIAAGDLNHDGHLDVVIGDGPNHQSVLVVLGNGNGVPTADTAYPAGVSPLYPALGDLNLDGNLDVVVVGEQVAGVNVLLGTGTGALGAPTFTATGTRPNAVALVDVDGDGKLDALVTNRDSATLSFLRGLGTGGFAPPVNYSTLATPTGLAVRDVNGDGWADVVVTNPALASFSLWLNQRDGSLGARNDFDGLVAPLKIAIEDMNTDGKPDIVVTNQGLSSLTLALNRGDFRGGSWLGGGVALGAGSGRKYRPITAPDGQGGAFVAWREQRGSGEFDAFIQRVTASGSVVSPWPMNGKFLSSAGGNQYPNGIARDGTFGTIVAWADSRDSATTSLDIYAQRVDQNGNLQWNGVGVPICRFAGLQRDPLVAADGYGGALIAWIDERSGTPDLFVQRVDSTGASLWGPNGIAVASGGFKKDQATMVSDKFGGLHLGWVQGTGTGRDIHAQRIDSSGQPAWGSGGVTVCSAPGTQSEPTMVSDDLGGVEVAWTDERGANADVYGQRLDPGGNGFWGANGKSLVAVAGDQREVTSVSDAARGMLLSWSDTRGSDKDVYGLRVDPNGNVVGGWPQTGVQLISQSGDQDHPVIVGDGESGAVVVWQDHRGSNIDLYAQRVVSFGAIASGWQVNGVPVCTVVGDQIAQSIVSDELGGAVAAWQDSRGDSSAIYAGRVDGEGSNQPVAVRPIALDAARPRLSAAWPNPSRADLRFTLELPRAMPVAVTVYSVSGRRVRTIARSEALAAGRHVLAWDGADEAGVRAPSGVYFVNCVCGPSALRQRVVLIH